MVNKSLSGEVDLVEKWRKEREAYADCESYEGDNAGDIGRRFFHFFAKVRAKALEDAARIAGLYSQWAEKEIRALAANPQAVLKQPDSVAASYRAGQYDTVNYLLTLKMGELVQALKDMKAGLEPVVEKDKRTER